MPMPLWWGHINKRIFNPFELKKGKRPTVTHVGRSSGKTYVTPLDAHQVDDGYMFILVYGAKSDWVQNILAAGTAILRADGASLELNNPRVVNGDVAWPLLGEDKKPSGFLKIDEFLWMDKAV
ncbi:MAG: nitroreductase family deazaflavin-dependent oxidoreductase [bacterium]|nr:nitroreductase family deazaflavin-dependent oxidoreductase [bacterium]